MVRSGQVNAADGESFTTLKGQQRRLLIEVCRPLKIEIPENVRDALEDVTERQRSGDGRRGAIPRTSSLEPE